MEPRRPSGGGARAIKAFNAQAWLGFIEYNGNIPLKINGSLLNVVLHD